MTQPRLNQVGFTILELMLAVGLITILAGLAIGFSGNFRREENLKEVTRNVVSALTQARAEAVRRSTKISTNFGPLRMYAFVDANGNYQYDPGESIVFQYPSGTATMTPGVTVSSTRLLMTNPSSMTTAIFDFQGYSEDYQGNPVSAVVCVKDTQLQDVRAVQLTVSGAVRVQEYTAGVALCP